MLAKIENSSAFKRFNENGFPRELLEAIVKETKVGIIGNIIGNHDEVLEKLEVAKEKITALNCKDIYKNIYNIDISKIKRLVF